MKALCNSVKNKILEKLIRSEPTFDHYYNMFDVKSNDIFICGFPKSGNTWMQNIIASLIYDLNTKYIPDKLIQELVPDIHAKNYYKRYLDFTVFKTHYLPQKMYRNVIHLVRDGRDAMCSYFAMNKALGNNIPLEEMITHNKGIMMPWNIHTREWIKNPFGANLITVRYEDLIRNPNVEIEIICNFLEINRTQESINRIIEGTKFNEMRKKEMEYGWNSITWPKDQLFNRHGKIGTYKNEMPKFLQNIFEEKCHEELKYFNYL